LGSTFGEKRQHAVDAPRATSRPLKVAVVGCGVAAQALHLPTLSRYRDVFDLRAVVDLDAALCRRVADRWHTVPATLESVLDGDLDAVLLLTSGDRGPLILSSLEANVHVFAEKPLCRTTADARLAMEVAGRRELRLMTDYMKWFDPAFVEACRQVSTVAGADREGLLTILTINPSEERYLAHHRMTPRTVTGAGDPAGERAWERLRSELPGVPIPGLEFYADVLLDCCIHDFYCARRLAGAPRALIEARCDTRRSSAHIAWETDRGVRVEYDFVRLASENVRYRERFDYCCPALALTLDFPSPYLRHQPTSLEWHGTAGAHLTTRTADHYAEAFELALLHFADCVRDPARTMDATAADWLDDLGFVQGVTRVAFS